MCDTMVALGSSTADGSVLFAKNSDREPNEAQVLTFAPRQQCEQGAILQCTYIEIPQASETNAVLLSRPFWMWGAEMGVNEYGVTIGNEAVFTKEPLQKQGGLLGMDMLRLALERASNAQQALELIIMLLAEYGQGGNCGFTHKLYYHNSFIIADHEQAWVLETAGDHWAALKVSDFYAISNGITIGEVFDLASPDLVQHAIEKGWCRNKTEFNFARCYSDFLYTNFSSCRLRQRRSSALLTGGKGTLNPAAMMSILRDHGPAMGSDEKWRPAPAGMKTLCVHAGYGPTRNSQSVASLVMHLAEDLDTAWVTATSAPCTGIFKPVWLQAGLPDMGKVPDGMYDTNSLWWHHELLHRALLEDYPARSPILFDARDGLEAEFVKGAARLSSTNPQALLDYSTECFQRASEHTAEMIPLVRAVPAADKLPPFYRLAWKKFNRQADMPS
jgi:dipeptidase